MNPLATVGTYFQMRFKLINGIYFYGQMLDIPDTSRVSNFLSARRYLRTKPKVVIKPGDVFVANGLKYIIAEHGDGYYKEVIYKHFKLFEADMVLNHTRIVPTKDSLTGLNSYDTTTQLGTVYLSSQPHANTEDSIRIPQEVKIAVCNKEVKVEDKVGDFIVVKSDKVLGVYLLELKVP